MRDRYYVAVYAIETFADFAGDGETPIAFERGWPVEAQPKQPTFHLKRNAQDMAYLLNHEAYGLVKLLANPRGVNGWARRGNIAYRAMVTSGPPKPFGWSQDDLLPLYRAHAVRLIDKILSDPRKAPPVVAPATYIDVSPVDLSSPKTRTQTKKPVALEPRDRHSPTHLSPAWLNNPEVNARIEASKDQPTPEWLTRPRATTRQIDAREIDTQR